MARNEEKHRSHSWFRCFHKISKGYVLLFYGGAVFAATCNTFSKGEVGLVLFYLPRRAFSRAM